MLTWFKRLIFMIVAVFFFYAALKAIATADFEGEGLRRNAPMLLGIAVVVVILLVVAYFLFKPQDFSLLKKIPLSVLQMIGAAGMALLIVGLVVINMKMISNQNKLNTYTPATAYVTQYQVSNNGYYTYDYYFEVHGKMVTGKETNTEKYFVMENGTTPSGKTYYGTMEIRYNENDPNDYLIVGKDSFSWFILGGSIFVGALGIWGIIRVIKQFLNR